MCVVWWCVGGISVASAYDIRRSDKGCSLWCLLGDPSIPGARPSTFGSYLHPLVSHRRGPQPNIDGGIIHSESHSKGAWHSLGDMRTPHPTPAEQSSGGYIGKGHNPRRDPHGIRHDGGRRGGCPCPPRICSGGHPLRDFYGTHGRNADGGRRGDRFPTFRPPPLISYHYEASHKRCVHRHSSHYRINPGRPHIR
jgi:hypothetical protein